MKEVTHAESMFYRLGKQECCPQAASLSSRTQAVCFPSMFGKRDLHAVNHLSSLCRVTASFVITTGALCCAGDSGRTL